MADMDAATTAAKLDGVAAHRLLDRYQGDGKVNANIAHRAVAIAVAEARAAERQRIRQLAIDHGAMYVECVGKNCADHEHDWQSLPFADLLDGDGDAR